MSVSLLVNAMMGFAIGWFTRKKSYKVTISCCVAAAITLTIVYALNGVMP